MSDVKELAKQIAINFELSIKERTDKLLKLDCDMYTKLGTDSTKKEKQQVKSNSKYIYKVIKGIDETSGEMLLSALDD